MLLARSVIFACLLMAAMPGISCASTSSQAFFEAVQAGDERAVSAGIKNNQLLINAIEDKGRTPLIGAVIAGDLGLVKMILRDIANNDFYAVDEDGFSAMSYAGMLRDEDQGISQALLCAEKSMSNRVSANSVSEGCEFVRFRQRAMANVASPVPAPVKTEQRRRQIISDDLDVVDLMLAVQNGNIATVEACIDSGVDLSGQNDQGLTPQKLAKKILNDIVQVLPEGIAEAKKYRHIIQMLKPRKSRA